MSNEQVMIHVRFSANGSVTEIGERPASMTTQSWFDFLSGKVGDTYQPLSGGRGVFRVDPTALAAYQQNVVVA